MPHYVGSWLGVFPPRGHTACGLEVWKSNVSDEAETVLCNRVEFTEIWSKVTCQKCRRRQPVRRPGSVRQLADAK